VRGPRLGSDAALVFAVTGLVLAPPAALLTFVTAGKVGAVRMSQLFTGVESLWGGGMRSLAILVFLCGGLLPIALLGILGAVYAPKRLGLTDTSVGHLIRIARVLEHWAIPEVQVLAVLVALTKLGSVVNVTVGPGFWCYSAMALALLASQRSFALDPNRQPAGARGTRNAALS
jgi:paraquat-inducible protein A